MKRKLCLSFFEVVPLIAALFVLKAKPAPFVLESYLERYFALILTFATWGLLRELVASGWAGRTKDSRLNLIRLIVVGALFGLFALSLVLLHDRFERSAFEITLVGVGLGALYGRFLYQSRIVTTALIGTLYYSVVAFLSFQVAVFSWQWEPFVFALGIGALIANLRMAIDLASGSLVHKRVHNALLFLGPIFIGTLAVLKALPHQYFVIYAFIPAFSRFLSFDPNLKRTLPDDIFWRQSALTGAFLATLGALAFTL